MTMTKTKKRTAPMTMAANKAGASSALFGENVRIRRWAESFFLSRRDRVRRAAVNWSGVGLVSALVAGNAVSGAAISQPPRSQAGAPLARNQGFKLLMFSQSRPLPPRKIPFLASEAANPK